MGRSTMLLYNLLTTRNMEAYNRGFIMKWQLSATSSSKVAKQPFATAEMDNSTREKQRDVQEKNHDVQLKDLPTPSLHKEISAQEYFDAKAKEINSQVQECKK